MGEFHIACTLLVVIGKRFRIAGVEDIIIESEIIGIVSVNGALLGKHYNRGMPLHIIVGEALFRLKWEAFCKWLQEKNHQTDQFQTIAARINCTSKEIFVLVSEDEFDVLYDFFKEFSTILDKIVWQNVDSLALCIHFFISFTELVIFATLQKLCKPLPPISMLLTGCYFFITSRARNVTHLPTTLMLGGRGREIAFRQIFCPGLQFDGNAHVSFLAIIPRYGFPLACIYSINTRR